jgi:hypothetical protein
MYSRETVSNKTVAEVKAFRESRIPPDDIEPTSMKFYSIEKHKLSAHGDENLSRGYEPANYRKAELYRDSMSYKKRLGGNQYVYFSSLRGS